MKKSTFAAILVFFSAVACVLGACLCHYLRRREAELTNMSSCFSARISSHESEEEPSAMPRSLLTTPNNHSALLPKAAFTALRVFFIWLDCALFFL